MPSIEIVCIDQEEPVDCSSLPFPVEIGAELVSHRTPSALFQSDYENLEGYMYHLLDGEGPTAYNLLKKQWYDEKGNSNGLDENLEIKDEYKASVQVLLDSLINSSKTGRILFTSDYQFGPTSAIRLGPVSISEFWNLHDAGKLRMNALYLIIRG